MIDRICVKVQDHLNSLKNSEQDAILEDVRMAENLIKDARNSKTVVSRELVYSLKWNDPVYRLYGLHTVISSFCSNIIRISDCFLAFFTKIKHFQSMSMNVRLVPTHSSSPTCTTSAPRPGRS